MQGKYYDFRKFFSLAVSFRKYAKSLSSIFQANVKKGSDSAHFFQEMTKVKNFLILIHLIPSKDARAVFGVFGSSVCNIFLSQH